MTSSDSNQASQKTWKSVVKELINGSEQSDDLHIEPIGPQQRAYLNLARLIGLLDGVAVLAVPSAKAKEYLEGNLYGVICMALSNKFGREYSLAVTVNPTIGKRRDEPEESEDAEQQMLDIATPTSGTRGSRGATTKTAARKTPRNSRRGKTSAKPTPTPAATAPQATTPSVLEPPPAQPPSGKSVPRKSAAAAPDTLPQLELDDRDMLTITATGWTTSHTDQADNPVTPQPATTAGATLRSREKPAHNPAQDDSLNPRYTFDTYVVSDSNKLPTSAAIAVAEKPARAYNPLFVWGDSGLGKTHLMHAIGNYAQQLDPNLRIKYVSSEQFTNDYINSVRDDRQESFKRRYRNLDILMVDDIQFLQGKEGTQEEFFHTFNALQQGGKQIVLSSDRPPKQLTTLEDRLRTRFQSGLIADIYPPDLETRIAILMKKAEAEQIVASRDVLELIASQFSSSIRELEGAFIRVSAWASLNNQQINLKTAEQALEDLMPEHSVLEVTTDTIMAMTAEFFGFTIAQLSGTSKSRPITHARQIAMYLCRELTELSLPKVGERFGRDHTTVMHSERKIRKELAEKRDTYDEIQKITTMIKNYGRG